jgi:hypothetical protein
MLYVVIACVCWGSIAHVYTQVGALRASHAEAGRFFGSDSSTLVLFAVPLPACGVATVL